MQLFEVEELLDALRERAGGTVRATFGWRGNFLVFAANPREK
jgi:hypothetical protein